MPEHFQLLHFKMDEELIPHGLPLVAGLTGFADSGSAVTAFTDYIVDTMDSQLIAEFDPDELLDYRARRPTIYFDQDHLTGFEPPRLAFYLVNDEINRPFILLAGYEPDFKWEAFSRQVLSFVERFNISHTTWVHAIPMPVPHTRPIGTTVSGNRGTLLINIRFGSHTPKFQQMLCIWWNTDCKSLSKKLWDSFYSSRTTLQTQNFLQRH